MTDDKKYEETYHRLEDISEYEADIYSSEAYADMHTDNRSRADRLEADTRMQTAAASFQKAAGDALNSSGKKSISEIHLEFIRNLLNEKLKPYSAEERRTAVLDMLERARELQGISSDGELKYLQLSQLSTENLERQLTEAISHISLQQLKEFKINKYMAEEIPDAELQDADFNVGAGAGAASILEDQLKDSPETIGTISGAMDVLKDGLKKDHGMDKPQFVLLIILMIISAVIMSVVFAPSIGAVGKTALSVLAQNKTALMATIKMHINPSSKLFVKQLFLVIGAGAAGLMAKVASILDKWKEEGDDAFDDDTKYNDLEEDDLEEDESDEDEAGN